MRVETSFTTHDNKMIITYPWDVMTETDLKTGVTKVFQEGILIIEWPDMLVSEFAKRQNLIVMKGQIVNDHKPEL